MKKFISTTYKAFDLLNTFGSPFVDLITRIYVGLIFWRSGRIALYDMDATVYLFETEFKVPYLNTTFAAYSSTFVEVVGSLCLMAGLAGRISALGLFVIAIVIQCSYTQIESHLLWAMLLSYIIARGPGVLSLDFLIKKYVERRFHLK